MSPAELFGWGKPKSKNKKKIKVPTIPLPDTARDADVEEVEPESPLPRITPLSPFKFKNSPHRPKVVPEEHEDIKGSIVDTQQNEVNAPPPLPDVWDSKITVPPANKVSPKPPTMLLTGIPVDPNANPIPDKGIQDVVIVHGNPVDNSRYKVSDPLVIPVSWPGQDVGASGKMMARSLISTETGTTVTPVGCFVIRGGQGGFYTETIYEGDDVSPSFCVPPDSGVEPIYGRTVLPSKCVSIPILSFPNMRIYEGQPDIYSRFPNNYDTDGVSHPKRPEAIEVFFFSDAACEVSIPANTLVDDDTTLEEVITAEWDPDVMEIKVLVNTENVDLDALQDKAYYVKVGYSYSDNIQNVIMPWHIPDPVPYDVYGMDVDPSQCVVPIISTPPSLIYGNTVPPSVKGIVIPVLTFPDVVIDRKNPETYRFPNSYDTDGIDHPSVPDNIRVTFYADAEGITELPPDTLIGTGITLADAVVAVWDHSAMEIKIVIDANGVNLTAQGNLYVKVSYEYVNDIQGSSVDPSYCVLPIISTPSLIYGGVVDPSRCLTIPVLIYPHIYITEGQMDVYNSFPDNYDIDGLPHPSKPERIRIMFYADAEGNTEISPDTLVGAGATLADVVMAVWDAVEKEIKVVVDTEDVDIDIIRRIYVRVSYEYST